MSTEESKDFYLKKIQSDATFKGTYIQALMRLLYQNQQGSTSTRSIICREPFLTLPVVIYTRKNFYLLEAMNEKIEIFKSAGLIEFWLFKDIDKRFLNEKEIIHPKVLTLQHLSGCFWLLVFGIFLSISVLIIEFVTSKYRTEMSMHSTVSSQNV